MIIRNVTALAPALLILAAVTCGAQTTPARGQGAPPNRGQGAGEARGQAAPQARGPLVAPLPFDDYAGFTRIFDGTSLKGWDGDPTFFPGGEPKDFELKVEFRMNATNSGIQFRSVEMPEVGKWVLKGYQADIDFGNQYTGQIYEERGRGFLALRGQAGYVGPGGPPSRAIGTLEDGDVLKSLIKQSDWNQVHIIARGNTIVQIVNGHVMSVLVDDDPKGRAFSGLLGFQMHVGDPMKVEFRNIWLKMLEPSAK